MPNYSDLLELLKKYTVFFQELTVTQQTKLEATQQYHTEALDECMRKEQAATLALRGFDKKRLQLQDELGFHDYTFSQIIPLLPQDQQYEFSVVFKELNNSYSVYKDTADCAKRMIELNIHRLGIAVEDLQKRTNTVPTDIYSENGTIHPQEFTFKDIKI